MRRGFTLVEVVVSLAIFTLVIGGIVAILLFSLRSKTLVFNELAAQGEARRLVQNFTAELRAARPSSLGSYPLTTASTTEIVFYSNLDSDALVERVRYYLASSTLYRGVIKPSGNPLVYVTSTEQVASVAGSVLAAGSPIFSYYDSSYRNSSSTPLAVPVAITAVRLVRLVIIIDGDPNRPPAPVRFETVVMPRNFLSN